MKTPRKRRQNFSTFCKEYIKLNQRELYEGGTLKKMNLWVYDFAYDAQNDKAMPRYPKTWRAVKDYMREIDACREAIISSWAAYWIWKKGSANLSSFERRCYWL